MNGTARVPGRRWYWIAGLAGIAGLAAAIWLAAGLVRAWGASHQFLGPGQFQLEVKRAGRHVVWLDYQTSFEGRIYDAPKSLPGGARVVVTQTASGRPLPLATGGKVSFEGDMTKSTAIGLFEADAPGRYSVSIEGEFEPRVFSVGPYLLPQLMWAIAGGIVVVLAWGAAAALAIWAYLSRSQPVRKPAGPIEDPQAARREPVPDGEPAPAPAPAPRDPEYAARQLAAMVYALQAVAFFAGITIIAGVIINHVKRDEVAGTWLESHFTWQIRTFWWCLAWTALGLILLVVLIGIPILVASAIWLLYRIIKGWIRLSEGKPMYV